MVVAVVTPYFKEERRVLERCIESVRRQTMPCVHYLVADGHPQTWVDGIHRQRHLKLPTPNADYGNTPRALGAMLAISHGATAVAFLDADNHFDANHLEICAAAAKTVEGCAYVAAQARTALIDGTIIPNTSEDPAEHIDTSCYYLLPPAFGTVQQWIMQPKPLTIICDRIYRWHLTVLGLPWARTTAPSLTYVSTWAAHYRAAGKPPPNGAKGPLDIDGLIAWWKRLSPAQQSAIRKAIGIPAFDLRDSNHT